MPTYSYKCPKCQTEKEVIKGIKDADATELCPKCNHQMSKQVTGGCGFVLKGPGFYKSGGFK